MRVKDKLRVNWSKRERDFMFHFPLGSQTKCDGGYLVNPIQAIADELERRGYDPKTLKFSIEPMEGNERFASQREDDDA